MSAPGPRRGRSRGRLRRPAAPRLAVRGSGPLRLRVGFVLIAMVLSLFAARLVQLQGLDPSEYAAMAAAEGSVTAVLPAARGRILDRDGEPLADSVDGLMIVADPSLTADDAPEIATFLARRLGLDYIETLARLRTQDSQFQYLARQVPAADARAAVEEAEDRGLRGLDTREDPLRTYPNRDVAANLVGFLGTPRADGSARPSAGLEAAFNRYLAGTDGETTYQVAAGNRIPLGETTLTPAVDGQDLTTTIDRDLQFYAQRVLQQTVVGSGGQSGAAVVMDSRTGELLALADYPTYDASAPQQASSDFYRSSALTDVYEPGSVEKVLTMASLIDAGRVTSRTRFEVPSSLERSDGTINDYFEHGTLRLTLAGVLAKSSNIGTVLATEGFSPAAMRAYLADFGLGERTGVGLGGETRGILPAESQWSRNLQDRIAFGQSLSVNAVQMTAAVNTIANGGVRVDPSLVQGEATPNKGADVGSDLVTTRRVVSEDAAQQTTAMMERVIDPEAGVAPGAAVPGYRVAGKTGTAQRVGEECQCYDGTFSVSFAGFAPADDPRFTIYVVVHDPSNGGGGGSVAGPAFSRLMGYALRKYAVPTTGTAPSRIPVEWR